MAFWRLGSPRPTNQPARQGHQSNLPPSRKNILGHSDRRLQPRVGTKGSWDEFIVNPLAIELTEATVHYVPTKPNKKGKTLTLIVINYYPNHKAANKACTNLKKNGLDCVAILVRP